MTLLDGLKDNQKIRDQLGEQDSVLQVIKRWKEYVDLKRLSTKIVSNQIGTSFILGHPTNGILGTSNVRKLGRDPIKDIKTLHSVVNPFDRFEDYLRGTSFVGTATTATVDTDNYTITF